MLNPDEVILVLSSIDFEDDAFDIEIAKKLIPVYESEYDDKQTGFKIKYTVVNYVGELNEGN